MQAFTREELWLLGTLLLTALSVIASMIKGNRVTAALIAVLTSTVTALTVLLVMGRIREESKIHADRASKAIAVEAPPVPVTPAASPPKKVDSQPSSTSRVENPKPAPSKQHLALPEATKPFPPSRPAPQPQVAQQPASPPTTQKSYLGTQIVNHTGHLLEYELHMPSGWKSFTIEPTQTRWHVQTSDLSVRLARGAKSQWVPKSSKFQHKPTEDEIDAFPVNAFELDADGGIRLSYN